MIKALYVDDEPDLLTLGKIFLERSGHLSLDTAVSARDALALLKNRQYDAIVSDYQMPGKNGIELLKYIREHHGRIPFILFTGKSREEVVIEALNNGADFYLQKGGDARSQYAELEHKINQAVEKQQTQTKLQYFNRLYAMMSAINAAILLVKTPEELYREVCRIATEEGKFTLAWIGKYDAGTNTLVPVASHGRTKEYLVPVKAACETSPGIFPLHQILGWETANENRNRVKNGIDSVTVMAQSDPAICSSGYHSTGAFPIFQDKTVIGVIQVYAPEPHFFMDDEVRLMVTITASISSALLRFKNDVLQQKAKEALRTSEERFRLLVEESLVGIYIIRDDRFVYVNPRFAEIVGYSAKEICETLRLSDLALPESRETVETQIGNMLSGKSDKVHFTFRSLGKTGKSADIEIIGTISLFQGTQTILGSVIDITERKDAERELLKNHEELSKAYRKIISDEEKLGAHVAALIEREQQLKDRERLLTDIVNFLPDATFVIDREGRVIIWNKAIVTLTGIAAFEIVGKGDYAYSVPFYRERRPMMVNFVLHQVDDLKKKYGSIEKEGDHLISQKFIPHMNEGNGAYYWFIATPLYDCGGKVVGAIESIRDISTFNELQQALTKSEEKYRMIIENTNEGVLVIQDDAICFSNPKIRKILGRYHPEDLISRPFVELIHPDDQKMMLACNSQILSGEDTDIPTTFRALDRQGHMHWLESQTLLIEWNGKPATLFFITDITVCKQAEEALYQANRKNALLNSIIRHDITNRLTVVRGLLRQAKKGSAKSRQKTCIEKADKAAGDIHKLLETARLYQDIGMNAARWQNFGEIVNEVSQEICDSCGILITVSTYDLEIFADPLLTNVIVNLIDNAIRHGEHVTEIRVSLVQSDDHVIITWVDNGVGIAPDKKEIIFEAGYGMHTGFGLFFSREILSLTGIAIRETGTDGSGAHFEILVPKGSYRFSTETATPAEDSRADPSNLKPKCNRVRSKSTLQS
ncbi:MAG: PAS domain S-box protein [Methanoregula sp.]|nr:PAS domain S-box protein [Methanoregula sp.]